MTKAGQWEILILELSDMDFEISVTNVFLKCDEIFGNFNRKL